MNLKISHIDLSERKILLRSVDVLLVILSVWGSTKLGVQDYITFDNELIYSWLILLIFYIFLFLGMKRKLPKSNS